MEKCETNSIFYNVLDSIVPGQKFHRNRHLAKRRKMTEAWPGLEDMTIHKIDFVLDTKDKVMKTHTQSTRTEERKREGKKNRHNAVADELQSRNVSIVYFISIANEWRMM